MTTHLTPGLIRYARSLSPFAAADREVLGGKGAELVEMARLGLPVPPAFAVTREACAHHREHGCQPEDLARELRREITVLEDQVGRRFGDPADPLLVSVRPADGHSAPGGTGTILDLGLNDRSVLGLAAASDDERFALDCYRRLLQMFGMTVGRIPTTEYHVPARGAEPGVLRDVVSRNQQLIEEHTGTPFPQDPFEQLHRAIAAVFSAWESPVVVQAMVFGNRGPRSGTGVAFTRDPVTGEPGEVGEYLPMGQGLDVATGLGPVVPVAELRQLDPASYRRLRSMMGTLERHHGDMCRIEFTVEDGRLWILEAGVGERSPAAASRIAADLVEEGWISREEAAVRLRRGELTRGVTGLLEHADAVRRLRASQAQNS